MSDQEAFKEWLLKEQPFTSDETEHRFWIGWQACAEAKDKEIEALRGFCKSLCDIETYDETFNKASIESAKKFGLLDENGNPTNLLTGEKE